MSSGVTLSGSHPGSGHLLAAQLWARSLGLFPHLQKGNNNNGTQCIRLSHGVNEIRVLEGPWASTSDQPTLSSGLTSNGHTIAAFPLGLGPPAAKRSIHKTKSG